MGLGVLDSDESSSNQSSSRNTIISSQPSSVPPASIFSLAMSDNCVDTLQSIVEENEIECNENTSNTHGSENSIDNFQTLPYDQSDLLTDFILSDSSSNEMVPKADMSSVNLQDNTPANLVPISRTAFGVLTMNPGPELGTSNNAFRMFDSSSGSIHPPEGRAIRNTSLVKFSTNNAIQKHKGRSPLATVTCNNSNNNQNTFCAGLNDTDTKKMSDGDGTFFMYQKQDPRIYKGEGE